LTGHLVLTTLNCNNAASAMPRLLDIGIEPYLLSTALIGVVSQRLLRVLCPHCKEKSGATAEEEAMARSVGAEPLGKVWRAVGCAKCLKTGYSGRVAVHEILPVTDEIASLIAATAPVEAVRKAAEPYGFRGIQLDALDRVRAGLTTIAEAQRVIFFGTFGLKKPATKLKLAS
ncbi:MAG: Flp pilus assembly complex ATPase component TadA, partial [Fimbriimonas ginsengisoli]|nr:Flp pilus assembly complex ATPase component TadA [Fimbriimonas ginsengisoli]